MKLAFSHFINTPYIILSKDQSYFKLEHVKTSIQSQNNPKIQDKTNHDWPKKKKRIKVNEMIYNKILLYS